MTITATVDLRERLGPARDQRQRPTCLVFATTAAHEVGTTGLQYLSTEFLFYSGAQRSHRDPTRGLSADSTREALLYDGQPPEVDWPYLDTTPDVTNWLPPTITNPKHSSTVEFSSRTVDEIRAVLSKGIPVILVVDLTIAMHLASADGIVRTFASDTVVGKHALLAVGFGTADDGDYILVRNSWGQEWGNRGHGWLHEHYLKSYLFLTGTIQ